MNEAVVVHWMGGNMGDDGRLAVSSLIAFAIGRPPELIGLFSPMFRPAEVDETILPCDETIFRFRRRCPETAGGYQVPNETAGAAGHG